MQVKILFFATLKEIVGQSRITLELPQEALTVAELRAHIISQYPQIEANLNNAIAAVNQEFAFAEETITDGAEVAFFPPVSGGSQDDTHPTYARLATEPIDHDALIASITTPATGSVVVFSGIVRGETRAEHGTAHTQSLYYEAYESMALAKMSQVAAEIRERWGLVQGIAIVQRVGHLQAGQNTILIACSSAHRNDGCFEAAKYGIDRLKEIVPVWKQEINATGSQWVEGTYKPTSQDR